MAVYTDVSDAELQSFLESYGMGRLISFKGIAEGVENSNFLLETEKGRFILTLYEKRVSEADLPYFLGLMEHLADEGLPCPLPVHDLKGRACGNWQAGPRRLSPSWKGSRRGGPALHNARRWARCSVSSTRRAPASRWRGRTAWDRTAGDSSSRRCRPMQTASVPVLARRSEANSPPFPANGPKGCRPA
ncbi:Homoserine kinase [Methyloligella halotolerans]|uniref:Homoserine kinase n=1 Tax=Methyloligella halotolerans TaxID=1177755 RepID=A0A1E2RYE7_9HYPH|nr:Homoserine kinase [Methyloligella halotolerans]